MKLSPPLKSLAVALRIPAHAPSRPISCLATCTGHYQPSHTTTSPFSTTTPTQARKADKGPAKDRRISPLPLCPSCSSSGKTPLTLPLHRTNSLLPPPPPHPPPPPLLPQPYPPALDHPPCRTTPPAQRASTTRAGIGKTIQCDARGYGGIEVRGWRRGKVV